MMVEFFGDYCILSNQTVVHEEKGSKVVTLGLRV